MDGDKVKLVCFDLNETLIEENTWLELNMAMGVTAEEDAHFMKWYEEGIISYEEGQNLIGKIYLARGLANRDSMLKAIKYTYKPEAKELVEYLRKKGYKLALLSGSVDLLVGRVAKELGIEYWAAHNKIQFDEQGNFKRIVCRGDDAVFKLEMLLSFCNLEQISTKEVVCVGDGYNDVKIFEECGRGVTFEGSKIEKQAWKVIGSLSELQTIL